MFKPYPGLRLEVKSQVIFKNPSKCGKFKQLYIWSLQAFHLLWYIVNNISPLNQSWFRVDEFFSGEHRVTILGPGIPFAETYKGFGLLPGKRNILLETYNISKNDVVEKKWCFTIALPYFPICMLSERRCKRHLIILPPPKKGSFWGGVGFLRYFLQFFVLEQNFFFGESMELAGIFDG